MICKDDFTITIGASHPGGEIPLRLEISSNDHFFWSDSFYMEIITGLPNVKEVRPKQFALHQNYPNPFNPTTAISYQLKALSNVELSIYNILGQKVATLVDRRQEAGEYEVEWDASGFASGVYIYRLITDKEYIQARKLVFFK